MYSLQHTNSNATQSESEQACGRNKGRVSESEREMQRNNEIKKSPSRRKGRECQQEMQKWRFRWLAKKRTNEKCGEKSLRLENDVAFLRDLHQWFADFGLMAWCCVASKTSIDHCHFYLLHIYLSSVRVSYVLLLLNTYQISTIPTNVTPHHKGKREGEREKKWKFFVAPLVFNFIEKRQMKWISFWCFCYDWMKMLLIVQQHFVVKNNA